MYNLLIVDDETFIADGLYRLFQNQENLSLEVSRVYTAKDALLFLSKYRIDIIITDIQMPGMNGLDMIKEIKQLYPYCHIIFLSGYDEFDYARSALHLGANFYLLKSQGDEPLLDAVNQCIHKIEEETKNIQWMQKTRNALQKATPLLTQELLLAILKNKYSDYQQLQERFNELNIPFDVELPFLIVAARLDSIPKQTDQNPLSHCNTTIDVIFKEFTGTNSQSIQITLPNKRYMIWLIQSMLKFDNKNLFHYVRGMLDRIQEHCSDILKASVSFIIEPETIYLRDLPEYYHKVYYILTHKLSREEELLLSDTNFFAANTINQTQTQHLLESFSLLNQYLEQQDKDKFLCLYHSLLDQMFDISLPEIQLMIYQNIGTLLINAVISFGITQHYMQQFSDFSLFSVPYDNWDTELYNFLLRIAEWLFDMEENDKNHRYNQMVSIVHNYIEQHLDEDISLPVLAEQVFLNPVYLSRAYKKLTGQNVSKYISDRRIQKAKDMLVTNELKINEVAYAIGYESPAHFSRVFKKVTGLTPQEYRDKFYVLP